MEDLKRLTQLSRESGVPESTIRRWIEKHRHYFAGKKIGKITYYPPAAVELITRIKSLYEAGRSTAEIEEILAEATPKTLTIEPNDSPRSNAGLEAVNAAISAATKIVDQRREIELLAVQILQKSEEVNTLRDQVRTLQTETAALKNSTTERIEGHAWEISKLRDELEALRRKIEPEPLTLWKAFCRTWKKKG